MEENERFLFLVSPLTQIGVADHIVDVLLSECGDDKIAQRTRRGVFLERTISANEFLRSERFAELRTFYRGLNSHNALPQ